MKKTIINLQIFLLAMSVFCTTAIGQTMRKDSLRNGRIIGHDSERRNSRGGTVMTDTTRRSRSTNTERGQRNGRMEGDTTGRRGGMNYDKMRKSGKMHKYPMKKRTKMKRDSTR